MYPHSEDTEYVDLHARAKTDPGAAEELRRARELDQVAGEPRDPFEDYDAQVGE